VADGTFEAEGCCLYRCVAGWGAAFYIGKHTSASRAKIVYSTFIQCAYKGSDPTCEFGAVTGDEIRVDVENLNFSGCYADYEGSAFSIECQDSLLRFISVENTPSGSVSAVDFDDGTDGGQPATIIENVGFVNSTVSWDPICLSGSEMKCLNCYFEGNNKDFDSTTWLIIGWIIIENCYLDKR
jgi:hypothetical protein